MATEKVNIDILFNTADAASSVKELKTSLRELRSAALAAGEGSAEFSKITEKAGELNDKITRVNENIRNNTGSAVENASRGLANLASVGAGAFSAVQGAAALFGVESKDLQQTLVKLNAAVALSSGLKSLAEAPDIIRDSVAAFKALNLVTKANQVVTFLATGAQTAFAAATGGLVISMQALTVAIAATGIGLLVIGIGLAAAAMMDFGEETGVSADEQARLNKEQADFIKQNDDYVLAVSKSGGAQGKFIIDNIALLNAQGATRQTILAQELKALDVSDKATQKSLDENKGRLRTLGVDLNQILIDNDKKRKILQAELNRINTEDANKIAILAKDEQKKTDELAIEDLKKRVEAEIKVEKEGVEESLKVKRLKKEEEFKIEEQRILNLKALEDQRKKDVIASENEVDGAKTIAFDNFKKIEEAKFSIAESTAAGLGAIGNIITKEGKKQENVNKGLALVQIAIDTARAIGSLTANSEANPANAVTFGAAGIAQFAAGIARILANIAAAKKILTTPSSSANVSSLAGGAAGTAPTIPTAPATPSATALFGTGGAGNVGGGGNAGQGGAIKVFVVESDITNAQRSVDESRGEIRIG
jgi:hypothetical protein